MSNTRDIMYISGTTQNNELKFKVVFVKSSTAHRPLEPLHGKIKFKVIEIE